jgi:Fic family protein
MSYQPPLEITTKIINRISSISEQIGRLDGQRWRMSPQLRKQNRIQTIQSTLAIEGNTLSVEQVTAILDGKRVFGPQREINEVQGAIRAYEALPTRPKTSTISPWNKPIGPRVVPSLLSSCWILSILHCSKIVHFNRAATKLATKLATKFATKLNSCCP